MVNKRKKGVEITSKNIQDISKKVDGDLKPYQKILLSNSLVVSKDKQVINSQKFLFNKELDVQFPITDQKFSGRCWIFAALNMLRIIAQTNWKNKMNIPDLEFSENYLFFWDKLERYHRCLRYYLDILDIKDKFKRTQYLIKLYDKPLEDGGQWNMIKELIKKYGIVPKDVMPDTFHSKNSEKMNKFLTSVLKQDFITLTKIRKEKSEIVNKVIHKMLEKFYNYLIGFLGKPPTKFDWDFKVKDTKDTKGKGKSKELVKTWKNVTPLKFLDKTGFNPDDWVSLVNDPRKEHPYNKKYEVKYLGNIYDQHVGWINIDIKRMKDLVKKSIDMNRPVWFGSDVSAEYDMNTGIHDIDVYDFESFMDYKNTMTKEDKLRYYDSVPNHAMIIVGYHQDDDKIKRWKIENSWSSKNDNNGYQLMTDDWFDMYVYQVVVHKDLLNSKELKALRDKTPVLLEPWDPLGTLA